MVQIMTHTGIRKILAFLWNLHVMTGPSPATLDLLVRAKVADLFRVHKHKNRECIKPNITAGTHISMENHGYMKFTTGRIPVSEGFLYVIEDVTQ